MATGCADDHRLYSIAQVRAIEQEAMDSLAPGTLMQRAGLAVAKTAAAMLQAQITGTKILVVAGPGNNGGDALEAAATLSQQGADVAIVMPLIPESMPADAQQALHKARLSTARFVDLKTARNESGWELAIDGLFGIGLTRALAGDFQRIAEYLNQLPCPKLAIDIPSGLHADNGTLIGPKGSAVQATQTISFIANKPGLHTAQGRDCAGEVLIDSLSINTELFGEPLAKLNQPFLFSPAFHQRVHASHKGSFGDLSIIGGAAGMGGALLLAARMGAMAGAGRVFAGFINEPPAFDPLHPEIMCRAASTLALDKGAIVAGPGMGLTRQAHDMISRALASDLPLVLDADALNLIAQEPGLQQKLVHRRTMALLTPHPLEAARLLETNAEQIQNDRLHAARELAKRYRSVVILKGSGSVIAGIGECLVINPTGNSALATAGTGDVLAGLCGSLLAQQCPLWEAALAAVWLHGRAADCMVAEGIGPRGITASEFLPVIRTLLNQLVQA